MRLHTLVSVFGILMACLGLSLPAFAQENPPWAFDEPAQEQITIDAHKYEPRKTSHQPILVIHETAQSAEWVASRVNAPGYAASFHAFIPRDGRIIWMVPPDRTAYTAGRSKFKEMPWDPLRSRKVDPHDPLDEWDPSGYGTPTVNHFAFQVELESPPDGYWCREPVGKACINAGGQGLTHSGYTEAQYKSLAWIAVRLGIPRERITTHAQVDITGHKSDPRSFDWGMFWFCFEAVADRGQRIYLGIENRPLPPQPLAETPDSASGPPASAPEIMPSTP